MSLNTPSRNAVTNWLADTFPDRRELLAELSCASRSTVTLRLSPPDPRYFGKVVEFAIGLDLATTTPCPDLLAALPEREAVAVLRLAGFAPPPASACATGCSGWTRAGRPAQPAQVFSAAARLTNLDRLISELCRHGHHRTDAVALARHLVVQTPRNLTVGARRTWEARPSFAELWASYILFAPLLRRYGAARGQVRLLDGRRVADFLAGTTLLELKTGRLLGRKQLEELLDQLLTYALLAHHDGYPVTDVGVYAVRHQYLRRWPTDAFLATAADTRIDPDAAGHQLAQLIRRT